MPAGLHVGYVAADNDPLPEVLRQIGIQVDMLDEVALAFGDLSRYDAIVVGIRAYELRPDLACASNLPPARLRRKTAGRCSSNTSATSPGTNFSRAVSGKNARPGCARDRCEFARASFSRRENPLLNSPNKITLADFKGWVQERGLYFWGTFDPQYQPVLGLKDPSEPETKGGLVYARDGKGIYIYTGLSFFRRTARRSPGRVPAVRQPAEPDAAAASQQTGADD